MLFLLPGMLFPHLPLGSSYAFFKTHLRGQKPSLTTHPRPIRQVRASPSHHKACGSTPPPRGLGAATYNPRAQHGAWDEQLIQQLLWRLGGRDRRRQVNEPWMKGSRQPRVRCQANDQAGPGCGQLSAAQRHNNPDTEESGAYLQAGEEVKYILANNKVNFYWKECCQGE